MVRILSITTADRTSLLNGNLRSFLDGASETSVDVVLVFRGVETSEVEDFSRYSCIQRSFLTDNAPASTIRNYATSRLDADFLDSYDFITFLDDDCVPGKGLDRLAMTSKSTGIVIGSYGPDLDSLEPRFQKPKMPHPSLEYLVNRSTNCTMYYRPKVLQQLGNFYDGIGAGVRIFRTGEDTDMCRRYIRLGIEIEINSSIFVSHPYKHLARVESISGDLLVSLAHLTLTRDSILKATRTLVRFSLMKYSRIKTGVLPSFTTVVKETVKMRNFLKTQILKKGVK